MKITITKIWLLAALMMLLSQAKALGIDMHETPPSKPPALTSVLG